MTVIVAALLYIVLLVLLVQVLVLLTQVVMAFALPGAGPVLTGRRPRIAVLVPAHNESSGVGATIANLQAQLVPGDRILVVADNCSDDTADAVRRAGADVCERFDANLRGKGYALDFGVRRLAEDPPEVVIVVDADCFVGPGALDRLARTALQTDRPVQGNYEIETPGKRGPMKKIAEFAYTVKSLVRPLGFYRLGLPGQLFGTGMALTWKMISTATLANGNIVEDMKLGTDLARAGHPPLFCAQAVVRSSFPASDDGTKIQRTRWEHGHMNMILSEAPKLLLEGITKGRMALIGMALDMSVPPLAFLSLLVMGMTVLSLLFALISGAAGPLVMAVVIVCAMGAAILLSWWRYGRQTLSALDLLMAVGYVFWKLPLYLKFFGGRQKEWVRAKRDDE
jgi:cellulose synthase/poly-beta-1,6-N-acetylglucosamine synthase-like glycosyltransferase